jgi:hypothetical protein
MLQSAVLPVEQTANYSRWQFNLSDGRDLEVTRACGAWSYGVLVYSETRGDWESFPITASEARDYGVIPSMLIN